MLEYTLEHALHEEGFSHVCGVDEAGRGPLAGPVFAAAVILPHGLVIDGLNDSKKISEKAVDEIKSGYIAPSPSGVSKPCEFCDYSAICLRKSCGIEYRKAKKVNLSSFREDNNE